MRPLCSTNMFRDLSLSAKRAGSHHVARRLHFDSSPGREPPRRRVRSLSRRARFPSVEAVCIPPEPRRDDLEDADAEHDQLEPHWNSYAAYDLARQTVDISIFRRAHEFDSDTDSSFSISTDGFWERRSTFEQWLLVLCASVVLSTCITLTYTFYYAREYGKAERLKQVGIEYYDCQTQMCKDAAIELKDTLNLNKDPCKNFYEYVCSLWPNRYPVPDDMGHYSVQDYVRDEVAKRIFATLRKGPLDVDQRFEDEITAMRLFYSCYNIRGRQHEGLLPLTRVMRSLSLSEWPYELGERLPRARFVLQRLSVDYGLPFFVSLRVVPDPRDARATLLAVDLGEPLLHANFVVSRDADEYRTLLRVHAAYVRRTMTLMGAHDMAPTVTTDVHDYEFALAEISNCQTLRELTEFSSDNIVTLDQLHSGATMGHQSIDNTTLVEPTKELLASIVREIYQRGGVPIRYDEEVLVWNISTFQALDKFLASENRRMLLNYLGWRVVALLGPATTAEMLNARHAFHMAKFGAEDQPQLLSFCFDQAARRLPVAVGRMAFRATGAGDSAQTQRLVARMVEEIRASLLLLLRGSDVSWLNEQSKEVAINKIRRLKLIQQPMNSTVLEWEPPELHPESSFGTNVAILLSAKAEHEWKRLGKYNYLDSVPVPQLRMSVSYDVYRNAIVVPAILTGLGLSTPGILALDLSPSINFGAFGYLVAHEMLRSIMFSGSVIDAEGNFRNWHFRDTPAKFRILVNCFESMLRRTITNDLMRRVRASSVALSQMLSRELVIGSTALPAAFKAYRTFMARYEGESEFSSLPRVRFSQNQLFFLYFAKSWCHTRRRIYESYYIEDTNQPPPDLRVNHILMDFEKFGKTFDCQLGDIMTPHFKCSTW